MGVSASSLLDESKSAFIRGEAEAELSRFAPFYRKQFSVARFTQAQNDLEQQQKTTTQLLRQRAPPEGAEVLYEDAVLYFDETRKWRERYVVVRAAYSLELHDGLESFLKGAPPHHRLLPTGGAVLTTEERYMQLVDRCFPDDGSVKEDFAPPLASMPGQFPVYLRLPYRRDSYFCFKQQLRQEAFISILWDCIRHQNQDFLKKSSCEVKAFLKAVQFYRESQGKYASWDMLIGSDCRVLSNAVMERLLPTLEKDLLPKLKAKKTEKKRVWFATVEAAYILVQECLLERLSGLKDECRTSLRPQEVLIHSDMDQILRSRDQVQQRVRAAVSPQVEVLCSEKVQPHLVQVLEELMEPISLSFSQGRELCSGLMEQVTPEVLQDNEELRKVLLSLSRPRLMDCFQKMASLEERPQITDRFGFNNIRGIVHSAQIDLQQLMENASFTFESLLNKALEENQENAAAAVDKIRLRVLKYFDYDSSSVRKRIFEDALVQITLPFIKEQLQEHRAQLRDAAAEHVSLDHCDFIDIDNVYEDVLLSVLQKDISTVLTDTSRLQKYNLLTDSRDLLSRSSLSSTGSAPASPALSPASPALSPVSPALSSTSSIHSPSPETAPHTPTKTQEVQGVADPAGATAVQTDGQVITAQVENANQESVASELQEANVAAEQTGKEVQVQTELTSGNKMEAGAKKGLEGQAQGLIVEDVTEGAARNEGSKMAAEQGSIAEDMKEGAARNEGNKMATEQGLIAEDVKEGAAGNEGDKMAAEEAAAVVCEGADAKTAEVEDEVFDVNEENAAIEEAQVKMEDDMARVQEETVPKQEANVPDEAEKKEQGEAAASDDMEDEMAEEEMNVADTQAAAIEEVCEVSVKAEEEEGEAETGAPSGGEAEVTAAEQQREQKTEGEEEEERMEGEREEAEEGGSDDEGSTTSDVLEENSQSPLSSEDDNGQSEERSGAVQETSEQTQAETSPEQQRPLEGGEGTERGEEEEHPPQEDEQQLEGGECPPEAAERPLEAAERPPEAAERPPEAAERPLEAAEEAEQPLDCIRAIRELVEEVVEVEELVQRYPSGVPTDLQSPDQDQD